MTNNTGIPFYGKSPCMGCPNRTPFCHTSCQEYIDYRSYVDLCRKKLRGKQVEQMVIRDYIRQQRKKEG